MIEPLLTRHGQRPVHREHAQAASFGVDQENLSRSDLLVYSELPSNGSLLITCILAARAGGGHAVQTVGADPLVHRRGDEALRRKAAPVAATDLG